jgi:hypothetical protein
VHVFGHYYGLPVHSTRRHLVGSPNAKSPSPRGPTEDEDGRRDLTLLRPQAPVRVEIVLRIIPGVV